MKVIVKIAHAKFFDGKKNIFPEIGDEIILPDDIAKREIRARNVVELSTLGDELISGSRKRKSSPQIEPEPDEDVDEPEEEESEEESEEEEEEEEEEELPIKSKKKSFEKEKKSRRDR
jgi:hypothetical protein